jgi:hypothetical protein
MKYTVRGLKTRDLFKVSAILSKMKLNIDAEGKSQTQLGANIILTMFEKIHLAEDEFAEFAGNLVGITAREFLDLPIEQTFDIVKQIKQLPGIADFFKQAAASTKEKKSK